MRRTTTIKNVCGGVFGAVLLAGGSAVIATACTHDDTTLFVNDVLAQPLVTPGQACVFTSDPTQATIASGKLDVGLQGEYEAEFLVGNQLVPQGNPGAPATETSYINIQGAVVRITDTMGGPVDSYTQLVGATVPPSVGTTPGYAPVEMLIVDQTAVTKYLAQLTTRPYPEIRVITYTRFFGKTLGGQSVESNEFEFPVDLCYGCLVSFPAGVMSPLFSQPNCINTSTVTLSSEPCKLGQDDTIPCTLCAGAAVCGADAVDLDAGLAGD